MQQLADFVDRFHEIKYLQAIYPEFVCANQDNFECHSNRLLVQKISTCMDEYALL